MERILGKNPYSLGLKVGYNPYVNKAYVYISVFKIQPRTQALSTTRLAGGKTTPDFRQLILPALFDKALDVGPCNFFTGSNTKCVF